MCGLFSVKTRSTQTNLDPVSITTKQDVNTFYGLSRLVWVSVLLFDLATPRIFCRALFYDTLAAADNGA